MLITVLTAYVFYGTIRVSPLFFPITVYFYTDGIISLSEKKKQLFLLQFQQALSFLSQSLQIGRSLENGLRDTAEELSRTYPPAARINRSFAAVLRRMELNSSARQALEEFSKEILIDDVTDFIFIFSSSKHLGGDSVELIRSSLLTMKEKMETENEIRLILHAKKIEFHLMCAVPFFIILYLKVMFSGFTSVLYNNPAGIIIMTVCLIIFSASYLLGRKIIHIHV